MLCFSKLAASQSVEYRVMAGSGLFHYYTSGDSEPWYSLIDYTGTAKVENYINDPYGNKNGIPYQVSLELKKITRGKLLWGGGLEYESVQSKKGISWIHDQYNHIHPATGNGSLSSQFMTFYPFIGYRWTHKRFYWDMTGGLGLAVSIAAARQRGHGHGGFYRRGDKG